MKFVFLSEFFECSSLALWMKVKEGQDVRVFLGNRDYGKILDGLLEKDGDFVRNMGQGVTFVTDSANQGRLADALRARGEKVFGGGEISDRLENNRSFGQAAMREAGISTAPSINFKGPDAFSKAIEHVKKNRGRWVVKQNGDADKGLSTVGKFDSGEDVMDKLADFKHIWTENVDFDLQEFIDGHEVGCSAYFNGKEWVRDRKGEAVFLCNFEHKKKSEGDTGRTTGETCTIGRRISASSGLAKELGKCLPILRKISYIGNIDINFMLSKKDGKLYGLEFTARFGYPALNMEQEMMRTPYNEFLHGIARGKNGFYEVDPRWAVVVVVQVPPFPFETMKDANNAKGQRVYFLHEGKWTGKDDLSGERLRHIHLYECRYEKETGHVLATGDTGYLLTVTAQGNTVKEANEAALKTIRGCIYTKDMDYRKDCGINRRVQEAIAALSAAKLA